MGEGITVISMPEIFTKSTQGGNDLWLVFVKDELAEEEAEE